jgi:hypothetical protein
LSTTNFSLVGEKIEDPFCNFIMNCFNEILLKIQGEGFIIRLLKILDEKILRKIILNSFFGQMPSGRVNLIINYIHDFLIQNPTVLWITHRDLDAIHHFSVRFTPDFINVYFFYAKTNFVLLEKICKSFYKLNDHVFYFPIPGIEVTFLDKI